MQFVQESISGVADNGGSGIGDECDVGAMFKQFNNLADSSWLIVVVVTDELFARNIEMPEQNGGAASIFTGDGSGFFQEKVLRPQAVLLLYKSFCF